MQLIGQQAKLNKYKTKVRVLENIIKPQVAVTRNNIPKSSSTVSIKSNTPIKPAFKSETESASDNSCRPNRVPDSPAASTHGSFAPHSVPEPVRKHSLKRK